MLQEEESYVIFLKRFPDEESLPMTTTEPVILDFQETTKEDIQSEESIPIVSIENVLSEISFLRTNPKINLGSHIQAGLLSC